MRSILFVLLGLALIVGVPLHAQFDAELATELQSILDDQVSGNNHGVSACIILPNGDQWSGQAGEDGNADPISDTTVFYGASSTKLHVAICLMQMVEEELVDLDDTWPTHVTLDTEIDPTITIRQLLNHTSGIQDYLETSAAAGYILDDPSYQFAPQEIMEVVVDPNPVFIAGTDFQYSNSNYVLLGMIVEAISGNGLYTELRSRIWDPMELEHTYGGGFESFSEPAAGVWWNFGLGFNDYSMIDHTAMLSFAYGAGGIVTTPEDQAILLRALFNEELVSATSLDQMMEFVPESFDDWASGYGMGLHHAINTGSDQVLGHDGYYANMSSTFYSTTYGFTLTTAINTQSTWYGVFDPLYQALGEHLETGVQNAMEPPLVRLFPNPATDALKLSGLYGQAIISVYSIEGELLLFSLLASGEAMDISSLSSGCYSVEIKHGSEVYRQKLMVLQ